MLNLRPAGSPKASTSARPCPSLQAPAKAGPSSRWWPRARFSTKLGAVLASQTNHVHEGAGHRRGRRLVARDVRRPARASWHAAAATPSAVESSPGGPELGWGDLRLVSRHGALWAKSKGEEARRKPCDGQRGTAPGSMANPLGQQLLAVSFGGGIPAEWTHRCQGGNRVSSNPGSLSQRRGGQIYPAVPSSDPNSRSHLLHVPALAVVARRSASVVR